MLIKLNLNRFYVLVWTMMNMLRQSYCYQKYKSLERNLVALFLLNNENK